jgi:hypothetical protein
MKFWSTHRVFNPNQFGYLSQKLTVSQLLLSYNDWAKARNEGNTTDVVFLDFVTLMNVSYINWNSMVLRGRY